MSLRLVAISVLCSDATSQPLAFFTMAVLLDEILDPRERQTGKKSSEAQSSDDWPLRWALTQVLPRTRGP